MGDNFYNASRRFYKSSKKLHDNDEYFNACYLAGYIVECYGKLVLTAGLGSTPEELAKARYIGHDLKKLKKDLNYWVADPFLCSVLHPKYIMDLSTECPTILRGEKRWHPIARYMENDNHWDNNCSDLFQDESKKAMKLVVRMKMDGVI